jgi:hypothetical protein
MIQTTRDYVLSHFEGSQVIYGDTDSVMVSFGDPVKVLVKESDPKY